MNSDSPSVLHKSGNCYKLSIGQEIFLAKKSKYYCQLVTITSIQLDGIDKSEIEIDNQAEIKVGLQFNIEAKKGVDIYIQIPPQ